MMPYPMGGWPGHRILKTTLTSVQPNQTQGLKASCMAYSAASRAAPERSCEHSAMVTLARAIGLVR